MNKNKKKLADENIYILHLAALKHTIHHHRDSLSPSASHFLSHKLQAAVNVLRQVNNKWNP